MELNWTYDVETKLMTFVLNDTIKYVAKNGGSHIDKYQDGEIVETFIRRKRNEPIIKNSGHSERSWTDELMWLCVPDFSDIRKRTFWYQGIPEEYIERYMNFYV